MAIIPGITIIITFLSIFALEDLEGCGIYDPGTSHPIPKTLGERIQEWIKRVPV